MTISNSIREHWRIAGLLNFSGVHKPFRFEVHGAKVVRKTIHMPLEHAQDPLECLTRAKYGTCKDKALSVLGLAYEEQIGINYISFMLQNNSLHQCKYEIATSMIPLIHVASKKVIIPHLLCSHIPLIKRTFAMVLDIFQNSQVFKRCKYSS